MSTQVRPIGVTIIAILAIISGIISVAMGVFYGASMSTIGIDLTIYDATGPLGLIGGIIVVTAVLSFVMAWGLLKGKSWAWTFALILTIISLIMAFPSADIISMIIDSVILYYLFRPHVKSYFGKNKQVL